MMKFLIGFRFLRMCRLKGQEKRVKLTKRTKERMNGWTDGRRPSGSVAVLLLYCLTGLSSSIVILPNYFALSFTHLSQLLAYFVVASFMTLDKRNCIIRIACCTLALVSLVLFFAFSLSLLFFFGVLLLLLL